MKHKSIKLLTCAISSTILILILAGCAADKHSPNSWPVGNNVELNRLADVRIKWPKTVTRFAVGSCAKERLPQPIWNTIGAQEPELFLFIGDNQYADRWAPNGRKVQSTPVTDPERFYEAYETLAAIPEFAKFREKVPIMGMWDDHDYGANDQGKEYPLKQHSQLAFLDFFQFPLDSPQYQQEGVYYAKTFGEEGRRIQFIMLDTRYHRDKLDKNPRGKGKNRGPYIATTDTTRSMLGEEQWQWLAEQLAEAAEVRFLISSVQVVAHEHGWETWGNMPHERERLYNLIRDTEANGVIMLSGDRHLTEVSVDSGQLGAKPPYPMWDFTVSGMTDEEKVVTEDNTFRKGDVFRQSHFGTVEIDWGKNQGGAEVILKAINENGDILNFQRVKIAELVVNKST